MPTGDATMFQHTAARRRLPFMKAMFWEIDAFQHTAARRRLRSGSNFSSGNTKSFNTQPPEGGCSRRARFLFFAPVSTHSRPKAAAAYKGRFSNSYHCFNTQPPEGGCILTKDGIFTATFVSTHSRPKAAAHCKQCSTYYN